MRSTLHVLLSDRPDVNTICTDHKIKDCNRFPSIADKESSGTGPPIIIKEVSPPSGIGSHKSWHDVKKSQGAL